VFSMWSAQRILSRDTCFPRGPCKVVIRNIRQDKSSSSRRSTAENTAVVESSLGIGSRRNGKEEIRQYQEEFTCDLKLQ
jgi:hypothetical protein